MGSAYRLLSTLSPNDNLTEFAFILNWPSLSEEQKQEKYSKYACHELNFFIYQKDGTFFKKNVGPYIANKKDKTFMDHWLLGNDLNGYLDPWSYSQLNVVERILLGQRLPEEAAKAAKHLQDLYDLIPPNVERANHLFDTAVRSSAMVVDRFGRRILLLISVTFMCLSILSLATYFLEHLTPIFIMAL